MPVVTHPRQPSQAWLASLVASWDISAEPEFRGFRCAACQQLMMGAAWHYWCETRTVVTPVHLCGECHDKAPSPALHRPVDRSRRWPPAVTATPGLRRALAAQPRPHGVWQEFRCDRCGGNDARMWHIWRSLPDGRLAEGHLCGDCGAPAGLRRTP